MYLTNSCLGNADAQKQAKALQEQLSKAEATSAAEVEKLQQAETKLNDELKQARLDIQQVTIHCCSCNPTQHVGRSFHVSNALLHVCMNGTEAETVRLMRPLFATLRACVAWFGDVVKACANPPGAPYAKHVMSTETLFCTSCACACMSIMTTMC